MLENWSGMDKEKAKEYILNCQVCVVSLVGLDCFISYETIFLGMCECIY